MNNNINGEQILKFIENTEFKELNNSFTYKIITLKSECISIKATKKEDINELDLYNLYEDILDINSQFKKYEINFVFFNLVINNIIELKSFFSLYNQYKERVKLWFMGIKFKNIEITDIPHLTFNETFMLNCTIDNLKIRNSITELKIHFSNTKIKNIEISNLQKIKSIDIRIEKVENFSLSNSKISCPVTININHCDTLIINNIKFSDNLKLANSKFENISIKNVEFEKNVSFEDSTTNIMSLNSVFFNSEHIADFTGFKIENFKDTSIKVFRTIKNHLEKMGNKIEANKYHSYEMKARKIELESNDDETLNLNDKLVFYTNEIVSEHSLKWYLPLMWMFLIGIIFSSTMYTTKEIHLIENLLVLSLLITTIFTLKTSILKNIIYLTFLTLLFSSILLYLNYESIIDILKINTTISSLFFLLTIYVLLFISFYDYYTNDDIRTIKNLYFLTILIPMLIYYISIFEYDFSPLIMFFNILDFTKELNNEIVDISTEEKFISKIFMGYFLYHFIFALRKDTRY